MNEIDAINLALKTEAKAIVFYEECMESSNNKLALKLFEFILNQEYAHREALLKIKADKNSSDVSEEMKNKKIHMFDIGDAKKVSDEDICRQLEEAMNFEIQGHDLYCELANKVTNISIKNLFNLLADQEKQHLMDIKNFGTKCLTGFISD